LLDAVTSTYAKNRLAKQVIDSHRHRADTVAREAGGELRTDRVPEFYIRRGSDIIDGGDFLLAASRWEVWAPDNFDPKRASEASR
jgi:hypothetical protein